SRLRGQAARAAAGRGTGPDDRRGDRGRHRTVRAVRPARQDVREPEGPCRALVGDRRGGRAADRGEGVGPADPAEGARQASGDRRGAHGALGPVRAVRDGREGECDPPEGDGAGGGRPEDGRPAARREGRTRRRQAGSAEPWHGVEERAEEEGRRQGGTQEAAKRNRRVAVEGREEARAQHRRQGEEVTVDVTVVGGGLAGCEAALQLAERGFRVRLLEMRPVRRTAAHQTEDLGELVCTNSFKSEGPENAHGQLKREMRALGSLLLRSADGTRVAAGSALAVDRHLFARAMTRAVEAHPRVEVARGECTDIPEGPAIIATGPLTSSALADRIGEALGDGGLAFFDAIAPIVHRESLDDSIVFAAGRFDEDADYLNCPMDRETYEAFIDALRGGQAHEGHDWDAVPYFEGCLPIEVMATRGVDTLRFGPMKPIGLEDPRTGQRPWAVVQLRREDRAGQMWNLVGFQTRLRIPEQRRI